VRPHLGATGHKFYHGFVASQPFSRPDAEQRALWPLSGAVLSAETSYRGRPANIFVSSSRPDR